MFSKSEERINIMVKIFEKKIRFNVKWHTTGKVQFLFFRIFFLELTKL